jgi:transcriptional regulator with XRE-family HTH domain
MNMDLEKIGKFIAERRKAQGLTQLELAERIHVTDRAVSKWECGRSMPDSSIMLELCEVLEIGVNELLTGEVLEMKDYNKQAELNLVSMTKQKEESDKRLLKAEVFIGIMAVVVLLVGLGLGIYFIQGLEKPIAGIISIVAGMVALLAMAIFAVRIEQLAGYYECQECHHRYVPTFGQALMAPHIGRSRKMKCPHCGKRNYHKKVISKD